MSEQVGKATGVSELSSLGTMTLTSTLSSQNLSISKKILSFTLFLVKNGLKWLEFLAKAFSGGKGVWMQNYSLRLYQLFPTLES